MLSVDGGKELLKLARDSIATYFESKDVSLKDEFIKKYSKKQGAFVTLTINGELRGCIGYTEAIYPLYETILNAATKNNMVPIISIIQFCASSNIVIFCLTIKKVLMAYKTCE